MVLDWLLGRRKPERRPPPARRRTERPRRLPGARACLYCGAILSAKRHGRRRYCSARCWHGRNDIGAARVASGIHRATNAERGMAHCTPVKRDRMLDAIAQEHAADMAARGYYSHKGPKGITDTDRAIRSGFEHKWAGAGRVWIMDNIWMEPRRGYHRGTARGAVRAWMRSPGHRQNMLDGRHRRLGVGVALSRRGVIYYVQAFC